MKRCYLKLLALMLSLTMLLSGCVLLDMDQLQGMLGTVPQVTPFAQMKYERPDIDKLEQQMQVCCDRALTEKKVNALLEEIWTYFELYNAFQTNYNLATIYYFKDMSDTYWENEYNYCTERISRADASLDELYHELAASPMRDKLEATDTFGEGFFDAYAGESIWDDTFTDLMNQDAQLQSAYYELMTEAQEAGIHSEAYYETYVPQLAELFVSMVKLRQETAAYAGYEDYQSFAYEFYHYRDYTPQQAENYLQEIRKELVFLYQYANYMTQSEEGFKECSEQQTYSYVEKAAQAMGGTIQSAFETMASAGLYDITISDKKHNASFETYLSSYYAPYVFVSPTGMVRDQLSFAHEFGHFCNDYATYGMVSGVDVAEVFSQGMEYLSLCYTENVGTLEWVAMLDSLNVFVEQSAYALFELKVYDLKGDDLTAENVQALYQQICQEFGFDIWLWDSRDYVQITHFFVAPMYVISYVVSNDVAMQIYQMEKQEKGTGLALYQQQLTTQAPSLITFVEAAKLKSPFAEGRVHEVYLTLQEILQ